MNSYLEAKEKIVHAGNVFKAFLEELESQLKDTGNTIPEKVALDETSCQMWIMTDAVEQVFKNSSFSATNQKDLRMDLIKTIEKYLFRSDSFSHSYFKPYGYSGDFSIIEKLYEMESSVGCNPCHSALVNCLEYAFSTIHSVRSIWERRHWLASVLSESRQKNCDFKVLDVACGGAKYFKDFFETAESLDGVKVTLLDQDHAALQYVKLKQLVGFENYFETINAPIAKIRKLVPANSKKYDLIISAGLFDYLNPSSAKKLLTHFKSLLSEGGKIAITNYTKQDKSAFIKELLGDWALIFRDKNEVEEIFPNGMNVKTIFSENYSLIMALAELQQG